MRHLFWQIRRYIAAFIFLLLLTSFALGQGIVTGSMSATVQDASQGVIPNAKVTATDIARNTTVTVTTDSQGFFSFRNMPVGHYKVTIEASGFNQLILQDVEIVAGRNMVLPVQTLKVGMQSEVVEVTGATPIIETSSSQIGATFTQTTLKTMPLGYTGFDYLALFIPGVANNSTANFSNSNGSSLSNNGLRGRSNNFQIDGQGNNDNSVAGPSIFLNNQDAIGEVQVVTNNFSAEYGRNAGSVVNYVTKAGTNQLHGTAFFYDTGNWTQSLTHSQKTPYNGYCTPGQPVGTKTPYTGASGCRTPVVPRNVDNWFGGTLGGPIVKDHAWFFGSYKNERQRAQSIATGSSYTPTPAGISALDSAFPGNAAVSWLKAQGPYGITYGNPTPVGTLKNVTVVGPAGNSVVVPMQFVTRTIGNNYDDTQVTGRGDVQISEKNRFFARYVFQKTTTAFGSGTGSYGGFVAVPAQDQQIGVDFSRTWSPTMVSQFRFSYSRAGFGFEGGAARPNCTRSNYMNCPSQIGFSDSGTYTDPVTGLKSSLGLTTIGLGNTYPQGRLINNSQWQSNHTFTHGRHTVKFGGEYDRQRSPNQFLPSVNGTFTFYNDATTGYNAFSEFIRGAANCSAKTTCSTLTLTDGNYSFNFKEQDAALYVQDDWRVRDNLTLNLGLRWDYYGQAVNLLHDITVENVADGFWSSTAPTNVTELPTVKDNLKNFGPNVGFAWTPNGLPGFLSGKLVLRGGFRIAYDPQFYNMFLNVASAAPVVNQGTLSNVGVVGTTGKDIQAAYLSAIPRGANPGTRNQTRVTPDFRNPYTEMWSLGIEYQLSERLAFETRYVGNRAIDLFETVDGNPYLSSFPTSYLPSGATPCADKNAAGYGRMDCNFALVRMRQNGAWSNYNGWQNQITLRRFHNFTGTINYTLGHAIDNVSDIFAATGPISNPAPQNPFNPNADKGNSAQDFRHLFNLFMAYEVPWMKEQKGIVGHILGGFVLSGSYRYQSGSVYTPYQNVSNAACDTAWNNAFIGTDSCRPILSNTMAPFDQVGIYKTVSGATSLYNVSTGAATTPDQVRFIVNNALADTNFCGGDPFKCTVGRNTFRGQPTDTVNLAISKGIKLNERMHFELRAEGFNIFNHQYLGLPGLSVNGANFANGGTFGSTAYGSGSVRYIVISGHLSF